MLAPSHSIECLHSYLISFSQHPSLILSLYNIIKILVSNLTIYYNPDIAIYSRFDIASRAVERSEVYTIQKCLPTKW